MATGVYLITNLVNGKVYVGSSVNTDARWYQHRKELGHGTHHSIYLQRSWNIHGASCFEFKVVEETGVTRSELANAEQRWMDATHCTNKDFGYNILPRAYSNVGLVHSAEFKLRQSILQRGTNNFRTSLTDDDVIDIRGRAALRESYTSIASDFGISMEAVKSIVYRNNWKHLGGAEHIERDILGSHHPNASLTETDVAVIKERLCNGEKHQTIANDYAISREAISGIARGKSWLHVPWPAQYVKHRRLDDSEVFEIKHRLEQGASCASIGREFRVDASYVYRIASGENRADVPWPSGKPFTFVKHNSIGSELPQTKLSPDKVIQIRERIASGDTPSVIARDFGVGRKAISAIRDGLTWKHVAQEIAPNV